MTFEVGDTVQPIGWLLSSPKPQGRIIAVAEEDGPTGRVFEVDWSNGRTSRVAECVLEATP